ncbi:MAG: hypothetical protein AUK49_00995 [Betaproteobacteria bacterium CG2_30_68_42]|nr:MAG: hypothetical protein AUK49_00995 [Betaproteobacteria bacterium CG2_30_68_42]PJA58408.1 MAG: hypothetical protein CO164_02715 [Rhodocyclales bacterium CG_4_9_14_3_um_filter_68_10]
MRREANSAGMRFALAAAIAAFAAAIALANPCTDPGDGIGGTGHAPSETGIGGTGVVGVITGFASICVNGIEVHYDATTPVEIGGTSATAKDLRVGHVVAVAAAGAGEEVSARRISVIHEVTGPVTAVSVDGRAIRVMGQQVTLVGTIPGSVRPRLRIGDPVRVSGFRRGDGSLSATLVERGATPSRASVLGRLRIARDGTASVAGLPVTGALAGAAAGARVRVSGRWDGRTLEAQAIELDPVRAAIAHVGRIELQGYLQRANGKLSIGGSLVRLQGNARFVGGSAADLVTDRRVRVSGKLLRDGSALVERVRFERANPGAAPGRPAGARPAPASPAPQADRGESEHDGGAGDDGRHEGRESGESNERSGDTRGSVATTRPEERERPAMPARG